jgi:hypothetical protein
MSKEPAHQIEISFNRKIDNSIVWKCSVCKKSGLGLIGPCKAYGPRGKRVKKNG